MKLLADLTHPSSFGEGVIAAIAEAAATTEAIAVKIPVRLSKIQVIMCVFLSGYFTPKIENRRELSDDAD